MKAIPAVYKDRVFKPLKAVELEEMTGIVRAKKDIVDDVVENEEYYEP